MTIQRNSFESARAGNYFWVEPVGMVKIEVKVKKFHNSKTASKNEVTEI